MKKLIFFSFLLVVGINTFAQETIRTIKKDTINIRGYVFDFEGKPLNASLHSRNKNLIYDEGYLQAKTDSNGYFELKGAKFNDTLAISIPFRTHIIFNKGARYLIINLPPPALPNMLDTVGVIAVRKYPRQQTLFNIKKMSTAGNVWAETTEVFVAFPGGLSKFKLFLKNNLKYPQKAIDHNIEGTVVARTTINKHGVVSNVKIINGLGYGCDDEAIRVLYSSPKWKPAIGYGRAYDSTLDIPIVFKLQDK